MKPQNPIGIKKASNVEVKACLEIRHHVFIEGQNIPAYKEVDGLDAHSEHYLLTHHQNPVGTARVRYLKDYAKVERVAILSAYQGKKLGHLLMQFIIEDIRQSQRVNKITLGSQVYAIPFYEKLGFRVCSDEYLDAGIPHKDMILVLAA